MCEDSDGALPPSGPQVITKAGEGAGTTTCFGRFPTGSRFRKNVAQERAGCLLRSILRSGLEEFPLASLRWQKQLNSL